MNYPSQTQSTNTRLYKKTVKKLGQIRDKNNLNNLSEAIEHLMANHSSQSSSDIAERQIND